MIIRKTGCGSERQKRDRTHANSWSSQPNSPPINPAAIKYAMSGEGTMVVVYLPSERDNWSQLRVKYTDTVVA